MSANCHKRGCKEAAANTLRITDAIHQNVDTDHPVQLCQKHTKEVETFSKEDVSGVKDWLETEILAYFPCAPRNGSPALTLHQTRIRHTIKPCRRQRNSTSKLPRPSSMTKTRKPSQPSTKASATLRPAGSCRQRNSANSYRSGLPPHLLAKVASRP